MSSIYYTIINLDRNLFIFLFTQAHMWGPIYGLVLQHVVLPAGQEEECVDRPLLTVLCCCVSHLFTLTWPYGVSLANFLCSPWGSRPQPTCRWTAVFVSFLGFSVTLTPGPLASPPAAVMRPLGLVCYRDSIDPVQWSGAGMFHLTAPLRNLRTPRCLSPSPWRQTPRQTAVWE